MTYRDPNKKTKFDPFGLPQLFFMILNTPKEREDYKKSINQFVVEIKAHIQDVKCEYSSTWFDLQQTWDDLVSSHPILSNKFSKILHTLVRMIMQFLFNGWIDNVCLTENGCNDWVLTRWKCMRTTSLKESKLSPTLAKPYLGAILLKRILSVSALSAEIGFSIPHRKRWW